MMNKDDEKFIGSLENTMRSVAKDIEKETDPDKKYVLVMYRNDLTALIERYKELKGYR